jgi:hypothetical protein
MAIRVFFSEKPLQDASGTGPTRFIEGDMFTTADGYVYLERLFDKPEEVPGQGTVPCRLVSVDPNGKQAWRPKGAVGPWEKGVRTSSGVIYQHTYLVVVQVA